MEKRLKNGAQVDEIQMNVAILMVTFARDLEFAEYSMRSVRKFARGFGDNIVVVPSTDAGMYNEIASLYGFTVKAFEERPGKGFVHHEAIICEADQWCPGADAVLHLDADCLFTGGICASDYFINGRPILYRQRYADFVHHPNRYGWKRRVLEATGIDPEWETMCRHPSVHLRGTYGLTQAAIQAHTGMDWKEYILSCKNTYPQGFAEFPTLGAVVIDKCPELYHFIEDGSPEKELDPTNGKMKSFWSVGGLEMINDRHPDETARQMIERILA